ncbi:glycosyltransferase family A protein [Loigolactobacillus rennini]|nr:glycosyltransferase [Loigolactobacillus rennini]
MKIGHLISGVNITDPQLQLQKMNIKKNAILINQGSEYLYEYFNKINCNYYAFNERGVGLSRNNALMRSTFDISIMSDDDMVYVDGYLNKIKEAYCRFPKADVILFNVRIHDKTGVHNKVTKTGKVHFWNALRYGTATLTFRTSIIKKKNITFSLLFGGGAKYASGEDSLFIWDCLKRGLHIITVKETIADVYNNDSTWFKGYNERYFKDKGALFYALSPLFYRLFILQFLVRKRNLYTAHYNKNTVAQLLLSGALEFKNKRDNKKK